MITIENVSKSYGDKAVLRGLSAQIPMGSVFSIAGASGSGKTTLLRLILGLERPDSGRITGVPPKNTRAVFQEDRLIHHLSARKNTALAVGGKADMERVNALLAALNLPAGDKNPVATYSGGMKRRVAIARALICAPSLLLLDEPFTGLDGDSKSNAIAVIREYAKGATILLVTHNAGEASAMGVNASIALPRAHADHQPIDTGAQEV